MHPPFVFFLSFHPRLACQEMTNAVVVVCSFVIEAAPLRRSSSLDAEPSDISLI